MLKLLWLLANLLYQCSNQCYLLSQFQFYEIALDKEKNSFPTIKLYKKEDNSIVNYNDERTFDGLSKLETDGEYGQAAPDQDEDDDTPKKDEL